MLWLRYTRNVGIDVQREQAQGLRKMVYDFLLPEEVFSGDQSGPILLSDPTVAYQKLVSFLDSQAPFESIPLDADSFVRRMQDDKRLQRVIQDVEEVEQRVERLQRPSMELRRILSLMIGGGKHIELQDKDVQAFGAKEETISLEDLSSGEKQLLRIFCDVLLADGDPIIIDEPELSLHIDWQRRLLAALRRLAPSSQIIVATHSPEIMADVPEEQIIQL